MRIPRLSLKQLQRKFQRQPDQPSNMTSVQLADMRKPYVSGTLLEKDLPTRDPIELFESWFNEVKDAGFMFEPNAVTLATTTKSGFPSSRMVLLKGFGKDGFVFFTNYESRKGRELEENPNACLLFYWDRHYRQVRVEGTVEKVSEEVSERYFHSRPRLTQLAAVVSTQSAPLESRAALEAKFKALEEEYKDSSKEVPKPSWWGGYCLVPSRMEFWQGHSSRLHDRIVFRKGSPSGVAQLAVPGWVMERLYP
ncbi:pyridoxine/pyridoxamine 5'-phosphate oxidase [Dermacentor silvarum]|uniref:pyridoxine/pyridoxamine 5'-phosphate oxidase n=1 Tax=Dermacentor silvarum TaxID=543639 RepID=UPI0018978A29|nr:pyridoxine/pyridoxamine 5'-phosphate oxidase [Dermacentor silvarum]